MDTKDRDRMTTMGELSTVLAHELKNPMNSIIINMEVLRNAVVELTGSSESSAASRAKKYLDVIEGEIKRLDKVIKGFLEFASPVHGTKIKVNLNQVIHNLCDLTGNEMKQKKIKVELELFPQLPLMIGSADQLKQALLNLLLNSLQALPHGGKVLIRSFVTPTQMGISIKDDGVGIDEKLVDKIFNPFFTTKAKGSGLGLSVARRVVKEHRGEIKLETEAGRGTEFTLLFPIPEAGAET